MFVTVDNGTGTDVVNAASQLVGLDEVQQISADDMGGCTATSKLGLRVYELAPGERSGVLYHYHNEQVEAFYVLDGTLHVETPDEKYIVESDQALFVDPGSPQQAYNLESADEPVHILAIGAPSVDDAQEYEPSTDT